MDLSPLEMGLCAGATLLAAAAAFFDHRTGRIPDALTLGALGAALVVSAAAGGVRAGLASLLGALIVALVPLGLHAMGGIGGGDVKLLAALGALLGTLRGLEVELVAFVLATALGIGGAFVAGALHSELADAAGWARRGRSGQRPALLAREVRFAVPVLVALAGVLALSSCPGVGSP